MTWHLRAATGVQRGTCLFLLSVAALGWTGCASEAALQPPSLHIAANVQHLTGERFGDAVELHWTTPSRTTDGVSLTVKRRSGAPFVAEICRSDAALPVGPCRAVGSVPVASGEAGTFRETLAAPWSEGSTRAMYYRVRIVNARGRAADGVNVAVPAGSAVPPLADLRAAPAAGGGVLLRWQAAQASGADRVMLRVVRGRGPNPETLTVEGAGKDPGGARDAAARPGEEQSYTAFRIRAVTAGKETLTLNSATATVAVAKDALPPPPAAPSGVEAVVNTLSVPEIDLVWQAADDAGVTGYIVYRAEAGAAPVALTARPVAAFSYSDTAVKAGVRYRYSVAAVNRAGLAGPMSAAIERMIPAP